MTDEDTQARAATGSTPDGEIVAEGGARFRPHWIAAVHVEHPDEAGTARVLVVVRPPVDTGGLDPYVKRADEAAHEVLVWSGSVDECQAVAADLMRGWRLP